MLSPDQIKELQALVSEELMGTYPELIQMLFDSEAVGFEEKKYWLQLLPLMSEDHVQKLRNILQSERAQARETEEEVDKITFELDEKAKQERAAYAKEREEREAEESAHKEEAHGESEDLLQQLHQL